MHVGHASPLTVGTAASNSAASTTRPDARVAARFEPAIVKWLEEEVTKRLLLDEQFAAGTRCA